MCWQVCEGVFERVCERVCCVVILTTHLVPLSTMARQVVP